jgi:hypothetical protein
MLLLLLLVVPPVVVVLLLLLLQVKRPFSKPTSTTTLSRWLDPPHALHNVSHVAATRTH